MLVIDRKTHGPDSPIPPDRTVVIEHGGERLTLSISQHSWQRVKVCVAAPKSFRVLRGELAE